MKSINMVNKVLMLISVLVTTACNTVDKGNISENADFKYSEEINPLYIEIVDIENKVSLEDVLKDLKEDDRAASKWLFENYKGRFYDDLPITLALTEMGEIAMYFVYGDLTEKEIDLSMDTYCKKYDGKIDLSHFKAKHSCMHAFMGADETIPYFSEFEFIGKTKKGNYAFHCTITPQNFEVDMGEQKYIEVRKEGENFVIYMIRCREAVVEIIENDTSSLFQWNISHGEIEKPHFANYSLIKFTYHGKEYTMDTLFSRVFACDESNKDHPSGACEFEYPIIGAYQGFDAGLFCTGQIIDHGDSLSYWQEDSVEEDGGSTPISSIITFKK